MIKLLLADARPEVRRGLRMWLGLQPDVTVVGETDDNDELLAMVREQQPDVVVLDVALLKGDPLAAAAAVREAAPRSLVVLLGVSDDVALRARAPAAGAVFLCKQEPCDQLLAALRQAVDRQAGPGGPTTVV
ncbi:MAG TPA: response regulator transcription factor [Chloroflexota bacterium]|nr:response regulator transcription factor [Chloroflexota bacterium]